MKLYKQLTAAAIAGSLVLNVLLLTKVYDMQKQLQYIGNRISQTEASVHAYSGRLQNMLSEMENGQKWITRVSLDGFQKEAFEKDGQVKVSWQIKDFQQGSKVNFYYSLNGEKYNAIAVSPEGGGRFAVLLPVKTAVEPDWTVETNNKNQKPQQDIKRIQHEGKLNGSLNVKYYISMENNNQVKSTEVQNLDLGKLSYFIYNPLHTHISFLSNQRCSISVNEQFHQADRTEITAVVLQTYNGENMIEEKPLQLLITEVKQTEGKAYHISFDIKEGVTSFIVKVSYDNGEEFSKKISF